MKTLTVTFHHTTNYGAILQTYALQQKIMSMGHENVILETKVIKKKSKRSFPKAVYFFIIYLLRKKQLARLNESFSNFHKSRLLLTKPYEDMDELRNDDLIKEYDCLITGSDQVWNLKTSPKFIASRLLLFGNEDAKRFSYAASLEECDYTLEQKELINNALKSFQGISVREESAKRYLESFTKYKYYRVLDPVFLLTMEDWNKILIEPRLKGPYILCYQVQRNHRLEEVAKKLKNKYNYPIVSISNEGIRWINSDYTFYDVSPEEFLGFYKEAAFVVSASFHGVALGLVFNKPVYALVKNTRANRIKDLMTVFGLSDFVIEQDSKLNVPFYTPPILDNVRQIKEKEISQSNSFINEMLNYVK